MANFFETFGWKFKSTKKENEVQAGYVAPQNEEAAFVIGSGYYGSSSYQLNFDQSITDEALLIEKYRQISLQPEVDKAINEIVNEAIDGTTNGAPVSIVLDDLEQPKSIKNKITEEFDTILQLMNFHKESYEIFRKWYVDGRMYFQIIIDQKNSTKGIQELRYISPLNIKKIREEKTQLLNGVATVIDYEDYYMYSRDLNTQKNGQITQASGISGIKLTPDSIAYSNSGLVDETKNIVYSYLQKAIRACNQLRMEEDAIIIYRLARAPERRVFYVDVGNLPVNKAEEYLRNIQARHRNKTVYDAGTGEIKDSSNSMSMMEDYWMPRREGGKGTEITTLPGGQNLGEIQDIDYFRRKLLNSLCVPAGRLMSENGGAFALGRSSEISREEVQFGAFIERLRKRFSSIFMDLLKTQLILKKIISPDEWDTEFKNNIAFDFAQNTYFAELKDIEILRERLASLSEVENYKGKYFSEIWIKRNILNQTDEEIDQMKKEMEEEAKLAEPEVPEVPMGGELPSPDAPVADPIPVTIQEPDKEI